MNKAMTYSSQRVHAKDLPSTQETLAMMAMGAQRAPSVSGHFPDFFVVNEWLKALNIKSDLFISTKSLDEVNDAVNLIKQTLVDRTLEVKPIRELEMVERYLGEEDPLEKTDIAIVFGGKTLSRAEKGAEMFLEGWAKKLLMTGKGPNYKGVIDLPEAEVFKKRAMELGVPEAAIICEDESINIPSNVRASLNLLDELEIKLKTLMSVISWYGQRRAWCVLKKYVDPSVRLVRVNADLPKSHGYKKGGWYKTEEGIEIVFNEFVKMRCQVVTGTS